MEMAFKIQRQNVLALRSFCLITGASKGLGRTIALRFGATLPKNSYILLVARSEDGLKKTKALIEGKRSDIKVHAVPLNLAEQDETTFEQLIDSVLKTSKTTPEDFEQLLVVHNAASLGDVSRFFVQQNDTKALNEYWALNLTHVTVLNSICLKYFTENKMKQRVIIAISSICSLQPFKSWSLYCAGKAARDMLFRTMALEEPSIRILNYAPGPIDTDMQVIARQYTADPEIKKLFNDFLEQGKLLSCDQSIDKLIPLLEKNSFDSGAHIDYYDI